MIQPLRSTSRQVHRHLLRAVTMLAMVLFSWVTGPAWAAPAPTPSQYKVGPGDVLKVMVYQSQDLSLEVRVGEAGEASYPLLGTIKLGGLTVSEAEQYLVNALKSGGYIRNPQVMVTVLQVRANFVNVLGQVARPGRYPLDIAGIKLTEILALAGGMTPDSSEQIVVVGQRGGVNKRIEVDLPGLFAVNGKDTNLVIQPGDSVWVERAPMAYVYGEVQRPGALRVARDMTVMQALASVGGTTQRGTTKGMKVTRRDSATGKTYSLDPTMEEKLQDGDVIYVRESLF